VCSPGGEFGARADAELSIGAREPRLDGLDADPQVLRYLGVPPPFGRQVGDSLLCLAEGRRVS
jgi:hypothetical protein